MSKIHTLAKMKAVPGRIIYCFFITLVSMNIATPTVAQDGTGPDWNQSGDPLQSALGLHYGQVGGHGLAFRMPVRWWLYVQVAGGIWHTDDKKEHNAGVNLNYVLRQDARTRIFVSGGGAYFYSEDKVGEFGGEDVFETEKNWNWGGGVGIEYLQGKRWAWKVEADFARLGSSGNIKVIPQAGISYYW
ncbi:MAG: hypothetical protein ACI9UQ_001427 [Candidatus Krumholzibacteriia bacterium]|jgi:hypothetical protein